MLSLETELGRGHFTFPAEDWSQVLLWFVVDLDEV